MAKITIAGVEHSTRRPADLDEQLVATTGCSSVEIDRILSAGADRAARALLPFLPKDAPEHIDLARAIADDPSAIDVIRSLYADLPTAMEPTKDGGTSD
ncbi:hypothetical protein [Sphingobium sp.]|uniref:hypothetical protein n=1 Tax=Sphingobium sp. TaxID=1912891 RepID=UPI003BB57450